MTTPAPRTPVRPARGLKANLDAGLAASDIKEGELVYAKDEDKLYIVEGGVLVPTQFTSIQTAADFKLNPVSGAPFYNSTGTLPLAAGQFQRESATVTRISPISAEGTSYSAQLQSHSGTIWFQVDGGTVYSSTYLGWNSTLGGYGRITTTAAGDPNTFTTIQVFFANPGTPPFNDPLFEGDILRWDDSESAFRPAALKINDLSDVDTATAAPTNGQILTWIAANSRWESASLAGATVRAVLGIGEYVDDAAAGTGGVASGAMYYNTTSSDYRLKT